MEALEKVEQLKAELDDLRPLDEEAEARIMQKFRLDWNYHSNNLEGNSLTYGETKALILFGITAQGKPLKDHFEITGHNEAINWIIEIVKGKTELTEVFIRQLHQLLLKESYEIEAQTQNGKATKRRIEVGKYKTQPNHVITQTGETFYFATPEETPAKMQELIEWFRDEKENPKTNPIILAALFHYKFIRIHPFDDGNGRVARILMNFILMQYGFPPVIIKTGDKENYFSVLQQADAGIFEPFIEYIADNLIRSLEIMIKGAIGESIEEPDDLDKELALLEGRLKNRGKKITQSKGKEILLQLFEHSIRPLYQSFILSCERFDKFYVENEFISKINGYVFDLSKKSNLIELEGAIKAESNRAEQFHNIQLKYTHKIFNSEDFEQFSYSSSLYFSLKEIKYNVRTNFEYRNIENVIIYEKIYSEPLNSNEIENLTKLKAREHKVFIEEKLSQVT